VLASVIQPDHAGDPPLLNAGLRDLRECGDPEALRALELKLALRAQSRGALKAVIAQLAYAAKGKKSWERLGYARLDDYAAERLGVPGRTLREAGSVGQALLRCPALQDALVSGTLGWTKVRLLARDRERADLESWIAFAREHTADALASEVRSVDSGAVEAGAATDSAQRRGRGFQAKCTPQAAHVWGRARAVARRVAGRSVLSQSIVAEMIAAEVLSAAPLEVAPGPLGWESPAAERATLIAPEAVGPPPSIASPELPVPLRPLVEALFEADAFELDRRLRVALLMEQRLDAELGPLLAVVWRTRIHRRLGYATREAYARERLGLDVTRARALVRIERAATASWDFARAYRRGTLSWLQASAMLPIVLANTTGRWVPAWIAWASRVTLRRLRDDVEQALLLLETDPEAWSQCGGLPPESSDDAPIQKREIGAKHSALRETCEIRFIGDADVIQLFRAVICTVQRRIERGTGRLPTPGEAIEAMCEHALEAWGEKQPVPARYRVFERDGWRCVAPGCTSMRNLHDHHIQFRSAGGGNEHENRVTLCAFHHLRGVHAGRLECLGRAPDRLRFAFGLRPGQSPLVRYQSGDVEVHHTPAARGRRGADAGMVPGHAGV
jgi:hypothetical protein